MDFTELLKERRSIRSFDETVRISAEELNEIFHDALYAPSWKNFEEARYYAAVSDEMIAAVEEALPGFNLKSSKGAAFVVATFVKGQSGFAQGEPVDAHGDKWGAYDAGLANAYFVLAARARGYDTLIMGLRDEEKLREVFRIPENEEILPIIAIGKRKGEAVFRPRKKTEESSVSR